MAKPYSEDLRRRVVGTIEGGTTIPEAAEQCGVSISSVVPLPQASPGNGQRRLGQIRRLQEFRAGGARGSGEAIGSGAAGHHAGRTRRPTEEEKDHGGKVVDLPVSASFEAAL